MSTILHSTEDIQQLVQQEINYLLPARMIQAGEDQMRGFSAIVGLPRAEMPLRVKGLSSLTKLFVGLKAVSKASSYVLVRSKK